ncbi:MAG: PIN domain-containing protein [bacterium]|nr:PIN domain-containing protein [bacterium]
MDKIILDTNIWVSYFNSEDSQAQRSVELVESLAKKGTLFIVPNYIDLECISVLNAKCSVQHALEWMDFRDRADQVERMTFSEEDHRQICALFAKMQTKKLSLVDMSLLYLSELGYSVLTFNQQLRKLLPG